MRVVVLDGETKVRRYGTGKWDIDGSAFASGNCLVTVNWRTVDIDDATGANTIGPDNHSVFYHCERDRPDAPTALQAALDSADLVVAHNAKFDIIYLLESGFNVSCPVWCTMIGEYILARGTIVRLSLEETAKRRGVTEKATDLVKELFEGGTGYDQMPLETVLEYAATDVLSCAEIFVQQWQEFHDREKTRNLINIVTLMNDMLLFLVEIERNGVAIDQEELARIDLEFRAEQEVLLKRLKEIVKEVMGDTPINLASGEDMTKVIFSRELVDKKLHKATFNIGVDEQGKEQFPPRMSPNQFANAVRATTKRVEKTLALHCIFCDGKKVYYKKKKNGENFARPTTCPTCEGRGYVLEGLGKVAGLKLSPRGPRDASINGFKTSADDLDYLILQAKEKDNLLAVEFLTKKKRLNALNTYINAFVGGIQFWTREDGILHANFNQTVARTGRLSSTDPNFQNQPKDRKFPIRRVVVSRWAESGGLICEADFSQLEFSVAGELSRDKQIIEDVMNKKDTHKQTGSIIYQKPKEDVTKDERNESKPYTFAPLYGGQGANEPDHIRAYFKEFFKIYSGHEEWQFNQMDRVIQQGYIVTPSGREYEFPGTRRIKGRRTSNATNIVNYPVQGFATGDIVPLACIRALRKFRELGLRSLLVLTVHDSIVADVYPGELEAVTEALRWAMVEINSEIKERWDYDMIMPMRIEVSAGVNWGSLETINHFG